MSMGHREKLKDCCEWDLTSRWRKRGYINRIKGGWKKIKRKINKRNRKNIKLKIKKEKMELLINTPL